MAMVNYPYETNFVNPLPAWPIKAACDAAKNTTGSYEGFTATNTSIYNFTNIEALSRLANVFYNYTG